MASSPIVLQLPGLEEDVAAAGRCPSGLPPPVAYRARTSKGYAAPLAIQSDVDPTDLAGEHALIVWKFISLFEESGRRDPRAADAKA